MYHHVVAFRMKPGVTAAEVAVLAKELRELAGTLPGVVSYACGADLGLRAGNGDFAVTAAFDSEDALRDYLNHPEHKDIIARHVTAMVAERHGVQFADVTTDPSQENA
ncbi:hypothetical protein GCM10023214_14010 [Amycolatopsis dongchuanensis]|uniref:Stress-response A/B barrel domain-containing protein n=1 Tax=Amycolatopsis dongchuanensis TaxID=1070866 RepID=A0ABP9Q432_9PSEU